MPEVAAQTEVLRELKPLMRLSPPVAEVVSAEPMTTKPLIWKVPKNYYTALGYRCGRWGAIAGYSSKSQTARWLKSEILPLFPEWKSLVAYGSGWFAQYLAHRGLSDALEFEAAEADLRYLEYKVVQPRWTGTMSEGGRMNVYHGLYPQCLWSILSQGFLQESCDSSVGHEYIVPGVYVTPDFEYAKRYAHSVQFLRDGYMWRFIAEVSVIPDNSLKRRRTRQGRYEEWVFHDHDVRLEKILVLLDSMVEKGDTRFYALEMELLPAGFAPRPTLLNRYGRQRELPEVP